MSQISPQDRGFTLGHGLFETVLWEAGRLVRWEAHIARMERGCTALGLPSPDRIAARALCEEMVARAGLGQTRAAMRLNWSAGEGGRGLDMPPMFAPVLTASGAPSAKPTGPLSLFSVSIRRNEASPTSRLKSLSYLDNVLARAEARRAGADEALMLNGRAEVACAAAANLFWLKGGVLFTPALECGVLDGTIRAAVLVAAQSLGAPVETGRFPASALAAADAAFLTNSLIGVRAVRALDGRILPLDPLCQQLDDLIGSPD